MENKKSHIGALILLCIICYIYFAFNTNHHTLEYLAEYSFLNNSLLVFFVLYVISVFINPKNILQPLHIFAAFYLCIFFITPMVSINANEADCLGINVMGSCKYATIIVLLAFLFFIIGYSLKKLPNNTKRIEKIDAEKEKQLLKTAYIMFLILSIVNIGILLYSGFNLYFLFSLGNGSAQTRGLKGVLFLINFSYSLLVPWLFICVYSKNKVIKILCSYILFVIFFAYGWRFIIYIMAIAYSIVYFRIKNKTPNFRFIIVLVSVLLAFSVIMGAIRNSIRQGQSAEFDGINNDNITYTLQSNFDIYKTYYGIVDNYPTKYDYWYGEVIFVSPLIMWVPRFIWPSKPHGDAYPTTISIKNAVGKDSIEKAAMASPNLTEYYLDFGILGVIVFSFILGKISKIMMSLHYSNNIYDVIRYALFCGFLVQLINRGYIPQLMTLFVFLYIPLLLFRGKFKNKL